MKVLLTQLVVLAIALPFQLALVPFNARTRWLTPGELRFWTVSIFVFAEICYLIAS
ncbi:MAG: hypothetical protein QOK29_3249 [Rhodospirillaceae bacterium]|nr:hypothetical protein [Rhodospirillaceae bacterium]